MEPRRRVGHEALGHRLPRDQHVLHPVVRQRSERNVEGQRVVVSVDVLRELASHDRVNVGRVGPQRDPIVELRPRPIGNVTHHVGHRQHVTVEPDRAARVADIGQLRQPVTRPQH
jgi:hypothetical protein